MKKKIGIVLTVILGISALGLGMLQSSASEASPKMDRQEITDLIKSQYPGEITELELDKEGTRAVYEAELHDGSKEYEIKLDGNTGKVLELDEKFTADADKEQNKANSNEKKSGKEDSGQKKASQARDDDHDDKNDSGQDDKANMELSNKSNSDGNKNNQSQKSAVIDSAEAEKIAKDAFPGTIIQLELDEDDGQLYYEIEMKSKKKEADLEINAYTGDILVMEIDNDDGDDHDDNDDDDDDNDDDDGDDN